MQGARAAARRGSMGTAIVPGAVAAGSTAVGLVVMRVLFGAWFLWHEALDKHFAWTTPRPMVAIVAPGVRNPGVPDFYRAFLGDVVIPNANVFRLLVMNWELVFSICVILGLGIRVLPLFQIFANLNYIVLKTYASPAANTDRLVIIIMLTLVIVGAGRYYGVDAYLRRRFRSLRWL
jgi:uncharacterized membrane protein YphA (DoxX/SURF4 family)